MELCWRGMRLPWRTPPDNAGSFRCFVLLLAQSQALNACHSGGAAWSPGALCIRGFALDHNTLFDSPPSCWGVIMGDILLPDVLCAWRKGRNLGDSTQRGANTNDSSVDLSRLSTELPRSFRRKGPFYALGTKRNAGVWPSETKVSSKYSADQQGRELWKRNNNLAENRKPIPCKPGKCDKGEAMHSRLVLNNVGGLRMNRDDWGVAPPVDVRGREGGCDVH